MKFHYMGKGCVLHGLQQGPKVSLGGGDFFKLPKREQKGLLLHLVNCATPEMASSGQKGEVKEKQQIPGLVEDILREFAEVFQEPKGLPSSRSHDHSILLIPGAQPVSVRPYRYPFYQKAEIEKIVRELLDSGVIRPSHSPFSSPVLLAWKADGTWRMCMDYRTLNKVTVKDKFPIPVVDELLDELWGARGTTKFG